MASTKIAKPHPFDEVKNWSVTRHGVRLVINEPPTRQFPETVSIDVENDPKDDGFIGLGIYNPFTNTCHYWSDYEMARQVGLSKNCILHNGISDMRKLQKWGWNVDEQLIGWDVMLIQHILDSSQKAYGLKDICKREGIGEWPSYDEIVGKKREKTLADFPAEMVAQYNAADCYYTYKLFEKQRTRLF